MNRGVLIVVCGITLVSCSQPADRSAKRSSPENRVASPSPPGNLDPSEAPQIIVFGWDDCAFSGRHPDDLAEAADNGTRFIAATFGGITNPDGSPAGVSFYPNGAYLPNGEDGGPWGTEGAWNLDAGRELLSLGFEMGNHTFDHLETGSRWSRIPDAWRTAPGAGWVERAGARMDEASWLDPAIRFNDAFLIDAYSLWLPELLGFRAPRLEINDAGLQAVSHFGYLYDTSLEDGQQRDYVLAAGKPSAATTGFRWTGWPYTLDNGSPGVWQSQDFGQMDYLQEFPRSLWELPVGTLYVPDDGLQQAIAERMKLEITDEDTSEIGDRVRYVTGSDLNTFLNARMTRPEWVRMMKHNFLLRYHGNRAPWVLELHPDELSTRFDREVLTRPENADYLDVLSYNTYRDRKAAIREFIDWVRSNYPDDVYFLSSRQLVEYMRAPFDKHGVPVSRRSAAAPAIDGFPADRDAWRITADSPGATATLSRAVGLGRRLGFRIAARDAITGRPSHADVARMFPKGRLRGLSGIDLEYKTGAPFRVRLLTDPSEGLLDMQVLLAGVDGKRTARIRAKDFSPDPYAGPDAIAAAGFVDGDYLSKVIGISFEAAATEVPADFTVTVLRFDLHGLDRTVAAP